MENRSTHAVLIGYLAWIFGFMGAHRFYYGKTLTGILWCFTLGVLFIGCIMNLFLIPSMEREAQNRFTPGATDYTVGWILLIFLGVFGVQRMYMGKWITAIIYLFTFGLFGLGYLYDLCTLNRQIDERNRRLY